MDLLSLLERQSASAGTGKITGPGDGVSDSVHMPLSDKRGKPIGRAQLSEGEYVIKAVTVSKLGGGATDPGAKFLDSLVKIIDEMDPETATTFAQTVEMLGQTLLTEMPSTREVEHP